MPGGRPRLALDIRLRCPECGNERVRKHSTLRHEINAGRRVVSEVDWDAGTGVGRCRACARTAQKGQQRTTRGLLLVDRIEFRCVGFQDHGTVRRARNCERSRRFTLSEAAHRIRWSKVDPPTLDLEGRTFRCGNCGRAERMIALEEAHLRSAVRTATGISPERITSRSVRLQLLSAYADLAHPAFRSGAQAPRRVRSAATKERHSWVCIVARWSPYGGYPDISGVFVRTCRGCGKLIIGQEDQRGTHEWHSSCIPTRGAVIPPASRSGKQLHPRSPDRKRDFRWALLWAADVLGLEAGTGRSRHKVGAGTREIARLEAAAGRRISHEGVRKAVSAIQAELPADEEVRTTYRRHVQLIRAAMMAAHTGRDLG